MQKESFEIQGGFPLHGNIPVFGAKNHALKLIPAALLFTGSVTLRNVPQIQDVTRMLEMLQHIGARVNHANPREIIIQSSQQSDGALPAELVTKLRASAVLIGPLLTRYGQVTLPHPGGDNIGRRPIDFFVHGFRAMGAQVDVNDETYHFSAPNGLHGATILFPTISVTGTETLVLGAVLAAGTTVLKNAACEPEIVALADFLNAHGASIHGAGTHTITIVGTGAAFETDGEAAVIPDRIEAGSFVMLAAATRSHLTITNCIPEHLEVPLAVLQDMGVPITTTDASIEVRSWTEQLQPQQIITHEYPGFPTDLQAPMAALLTQAHGQSSIRETIYEGRLFYTEMLNRLGAHMTMLDPHRVTIYGPTLLTGAEVESQDIRAGAAVLIAALTAQGTTLIKNIYHIDRGYERIEERLQAIGANITRIRGA